MPTIREIIEFLPERNHRLLEGYRPDSSIEHARSILEAGSCDVTFCSTMARDPQALLAKTRAALLIVDKLIPINETAMAQAGVQALVFSDNARLDFILLMERFFAPPRPKGIHPSAVIAPSATIGSDVFIGPLCTIGEDVKIGDKTVIHAGVHIYSRVRIGCNVTIHSGTVIGADGFGYQRNDTGELIKFPHLGGIIIEDNVEIGANTCIDRSTLGDTRICQGVCIDNLVHIAHNVYVGQHAAVIADAMIGGSTHIGDYAWIAPSACLRDGITVGDRSIVGLAALVTRDVPGGETVLGSPARKIGEQKRLLAHWAAIAVPDDQE